MEYMTKEKEQKNCLPKLKGQIIAHLIEAIDSN